MAGLTLILIFTLICVASTLRAWLNARDLEAAEPNARAHEPHPRGLPGPSNSWAVTRGENFLARREIDRIGESR